MSLKFLEKPDAYVYVNDEQFYFPKSIVEEFSLRHRQWVTIEVDNEDTGELVILFRSGLNEEENFRIINSAIKQTSRQHNRFIVSAKILISKLAITGTYYNVQEYNNGVYKGMLLKPILN